MYLLEQVKVMNGWHITDIAGTQLIPTRVEQAGMDQAEDAMSFTSDMVVSLNHDVYWIAPGQYIGNKVRHRMNSVSSATAQFNNVYQQQTIGGGSEEQGRVTRSLFWFWGFLSSVKLCLFVLMLVGQSIVQYCST